MKTGLIIGSVVIALLIGSTWLSGSLQESNPDILARNGLHWHPLLAIYVKGEKVEISQGIGLGAVHRPVHTHEDLPIIHLEFSGIVRREDVTLGEFFKSWERDMRSFGTNMQMTVNGKENTEYEKYVMHDGDNIELRYD
ncbi:hypothetical protein EXS56_00205 [Candidatus Kaiserbacteria bacterium]|nr:hypothetical protein [Candidatus Kaiserbacteria bacterium]